MVDTGRFLPLSHPRHAEVTKISGDRHVLNDDLFLPPVGSFHDPDAPFIGLKVVFLFTCQFASVTAAAPFIINV
jgi:hypothetical protein